MQSSLPRRLRLGIELSHSAQNAFSPDGAMVLRVSARGMAEAAGMKAGDVLTSVGGFPVTSAAELQVALRSAVAGRPEGNVTLAFLRDGHAREMSVTASRVPHEEGVLYDSVELRARGRGGGGVRADTIRLRTMIHRPDGQGRKPAIVFIQGLSVATMDGAFPDLFRGWQREGFVAMRIEKRGVGDSEGESPELGDFHTEVDDVRQAVRALVHYDFVDPDAVFVFGHSVGGMIAPMLDVDDEGQDRLIGGYITYGSSAEPWFDCLEATTRRQLAMQGRVVADDHAETFRDEMMRTNDVIDGRPSVYHRQLHEADVASFWRRIDRPVLVLHGEYDWVVSEPEARRIAELSRGTLRSLPNLDHLMTSHESIEASMGHYGKGRFDPSVIVESCAWLRQIMAGRG